MKPGWLLRGLAEAARYAKRNPDVAQSVHDAPSPFLNPEPCPPGCIYCKRAARARKLAARVREGGR